MATEAEIVDVVALLAGIYNREPGDMRGFYWALEDTSADILQEAAQAWVKREKWMPSPSELRQLCEPIQNSRLRYARHVQLFGDVLAGRRDDERAWMSCLDYFPRGVDVPSVPDTRTDAEIEQEWQAWQRAG